MTCSPHDLRDYFFEELKAEERRQVDEHLHGCARCREELAKLRVTQQALLQLKDEEIPRRIAFVSDKVFEPSRAARWWTALSVRVPRLVFSLALLLAVFFAGAWASRPSITVENGRWQIAFGGAGREIDQKLATFEARHSAEIHNAEQAFEQLDKEVKVLYRQSVEPRSAAYRQ